VQGRITVVQKGDRDRVYFGPDREEIAKKLPELRPEKAGNTQVPVKTKGLSGRNWTQAIWSPREPS